MQQGREKGAVMIHIPYVPDWFVKLVIALAIVGAITIFVSIIAGIVWLVNHVRLV